MVAVGVTGGGGDPRAGRHARSARSAGGGSVGSTGIAQVGRGVGDLVEHVVDHHLDRPLVRGRVGGLAAAAGKLCRQGLHDEVAEAAHAGAGGPDGRAQGGEPELLGPALGDDGGALGTRLAVLPGEDREPQAVLAGLGAQLEPEPVAGLRLEGLAASDPPLAGGQGEVHTGRRA